MSNYQAISPQGQYYQAPYFQSQGQYYQPQAQPIDPYSAQAEYWRSVRDQYGQPFTQQNYQMPVQQQIQPQQPQQRQQTPMGQIFAYPVTNIDEAKGMRIDAFNTFIFDDPSAEKIYKKKINNDGLPVFQTYILENVQPTTQPTEQSENTTPPDTVAIHRTDLNKIEALINRITTLEQFCKEIRDNGNNATDKFTSTDEQSPGTSTAIIYARPNNSEGNANDTGQE